MLRYILIVNLIAGILIGISILIEQRKKNQFYSKLKAFFDSIDSTYHSFIKKRLTLGILSNEDIMVDQTKLSEEAFDILKPDVEALFIFLDYQPTKLSGFSHHSPYFSSVINIVGTYLSKGNESGRRLSKTEKEVIQTNLIKSIQVDIQKRIVELKTQVLID